MYAIQYIGYKKKKIIHFFSKKSYSHKNEQKKNYIKVPLIYVQLTIKVRQYDWKSPFVIFIKYIFFFNYFLKLSQLYKMIREKMCKKKDTLSGYIYISSIYILGVQNLILLFAYLKQLFALITILFELISAYQHKKKYGNLLRTGKQQSQTKKKCIPFV